MQPITFEAARNRLLLAVLLSYATVGALLPFSKISVDYMSFMDGYFAVTPFLLADFYARWFKAGRLSVALEVAAAGFLLIVPITILSYLAISLAKPLADGQLMALDAAIGFDWPTFIAYVEARPRLAATLGSAYTSFFTQLIFIPIYVAFSGQGARACAIVFSYIVLCFLSSLISVWFPSVGAFVAYDIGLDDVSSIKAKYGFHFLESFHAVRDQAAYLLTESKTAGILTFPSVHAGAAGLCIWAAWNSRILRYPVLILNVAMAVSAISHGGHYLIDVIAGLAAAAVSVATAKAVFYRRAFSVGNAVDFKLAGNPAT